MKLTRWVVMVALLLGFVSFAAERPMYVPGTRTKGSNLTEPKPKEGEVLKTLHAGFVVMEKKAAYYLRAEITKPGDYYFRIEYENPADKSKPFVNDMEVTPKNKEIEFSSPDFVKGIRMYGDYEIRVKVFAKRDSKEELERLEQTVRAYVDTTGSEVKLFKKLKPRP